MTRDDANLPDRAYVDGQQPCVIAQSESAAAAKPAKLDAAEIFASIGDVPYDWRIASDVLLWGRNVGAVLKIRDSDAIATGRGYAQFLHPESRQARFDDGDALAGAR